MRNPGRWMVEVAAVALALGACASSPQTSSSGGTTPPTAPSAAHSTSPAESPSDSPSGPGGGIRVAGGRYSLIDLTPEVYYGDNYDAGTGLALNNAGQVVGTESSGGTFRWDPTTGVTDLPDAQSANDINELGQVALANGHALVWDPTTGITDLGTLPGADRTSADAITDQGQVAGTATFFGTDETEDQVQRAIVGDRVAGVTYLGTLGGGSYAVDINEQGQVVGASEAIDEDGGPEEHAFLWHRGTGMKDLGAPGWAQSHGVAVNERGQVAGTAEMVDSESSSEHAFLWDPDTGAKDLGLLPDGSSSEAADINDKGQVVGTVYTSEGARAYVWGPRTGMLDLGTLGGGDASAVDINEAGQVTGWSSTQDGGQHAFVWDSDTGMIDLGALEAGHDSEAQAINDRGQVVGWSGPPEDDREDCACLAQAVIWTPVTAEDATHQESPTP